MSQIFKSSLSGPVPPTVPTSFVTDSGTIIPAANVVNLNGGTTTANNNNGITVIANPTGSNNGVIELTNRIQGSATTTDGVTPVTFATFALGASPGTYIFTINLVAFNLTDALSAGYDVTSVIRTTGAAAIKIGLDTFVEKEEGTMSGVVATILLSGNTFNLQVTGLAGKTIHWNAVITYVFVS